MQTVYCIYMHNFGLKQKAYLQSIYTHNTLHLNARDAIAIINAVK